ncbi:MAG: PTS transporter subunit IIC, partial [Candidatus Njordarchaeales archaeon]
MAITAVDILDFIIAFFKNPALLLGIITGIGLWLQKRPWEQIITSSIKAAIGVLLILSGAGLLSDAI